MNRLSANAASIEQAIPNDPIINRVMILKALIVALVVGSVLLVINQFGVFMGQEKLRLLPAVLSYCVPFCVFLGGKFVS
ncbi:MAG: nitrate/nitrite transporter NrtS [Pseudomonadales bacterium]|nr:nitrate/nitrite transporter NrtS [Pseudomonadales bacterium]